MFAVDWFFGLQRINNRWRSRELTEHKGQWLIIESISTGYFVNNGSLFFFKLQTIGNMKGSISQLISTTSSQTVNLISLPVEYVISPMNIIFLILQRWKRQVLFQLNICDKAMQ